MPEKTVVYERRRLYEQVWSAPVSQVAKQYLVSDVALAKLCRRLDVPVPGRGYWARVAAGQEVKRIPLPRGRTGQPEHVHARRGRAPVEGNGRRDEVKAQLGAEEHAEVRIEVAASLEEPHPLVAITARALGKAKVSGGLVERGGRRVLALRVAPGSLDRALRIADALVKALAARGYTVEATAPAAAAVDRYGREEHAAKASTTRVRIGDDWIEFGLSEQTRPDPPSMPRPKWATATPEERLAWHDRPIPKQVGTGCLSLHIDRGKYLRTQRSWSDTEKRRLETCLNAVVRGLVTTAEAVRLHRLANDEREREWNEQDRRRREEEERQQKDARRAEQIAKQIDAWRLARDLRAYVAEVTALVGPAELEITGNANEELRWALAYADRLDPLTPWREQVRAPRPACGKIHEGGAAPHRAVSVGVDDALSAKYPPECICPQGGRRSEAPASP